MSWCGFHEQVEHRLAILNEKPEIPEHQTAFRLRRRVEALASVLKLFEERLEQFGSELARVQEGVRGHDCKSCGKWWVIHNLKQILKCNKNQQRSL
jgi:hypothetical protein